MASLCWAICIEFKGREICCQLAVLCSVVGSMITSQLLNTKLGTSGTECVSPHSLSSRVKVKRQVAMSKLVPRHRKICTTLQVLQTAGVGFTSTNQTDQVSWYVTQASLRAGTPLITIAQTPSSKVDTYVWVPSPESESCF